MLALPLPLLRLAAAAAAEAASGLVTLPTVVAFLSLLLVSGLSGMVCMCAAVVCAVLILDNSGAWNRGTMLLVVVIGAVWIGITNVDCVGMLVLCDLAGIVASLMVVMEVWGRD